MSERLRWWLFGKLAKVPGVCNASIGCWAAWDDLEQVRDGRWRVSPMCRRDAADNGRCWCGKVSAPTPVGVDASKGETDG